MQESHQEELEDLLAGRLIRQLEADELGDVKPMTEKTDLGDRGGESAIEKTSNELSGDISHGDEPSSIASIETTIVATGTTDIEEPNLPLDPASTSAPAAFAKVEKSLISLGFFTPSSRRIKDQKVKRISFTRSINGKKVEGTAEFHPSALLGLPITADQDKFLALHDIITNLLQTQGKITNPIRFTSADLLRLLNKRVRTGKNYKDISEWLDVMTATMIVSNGVVYEAGKQRFARDRFHVFDRAVSVGKEMPDGTIADANYVWLSEWQLENINHKFLLPIDLLTYRELKFHIAKALVPLLQVWLFASQKAGSFEKRYDELCEMLSVQTYTVPSLITRQLKPSLDELIRYEYLEKWLIIKTSDKKAYKIVFFHGPKFHRDRRRRLEQKHQTEQTVLIAQSETMEPELPQPGRLEFEPAAPAIGVTQQIGSDTVKTTVRKTAKKSQLVQAESPTLFVPDAAPDQVVEEPNVIDELAARGLMPSIAMKLLSAVPADQMERVHDYIEYWDGAKKQGNVGPGLLHELIKNFQPLPRTFVPKREREVKKREAKRSADRWTVKEAMNQRYDAYRDQALDRFIAEVVTAEEFERRVTECIRELSAQASLDLPSIWNRPETIERQARAKVRVEIGKQVPFVTFEDFQKRELPRILSELRIEPTDLGIELPSKPVEPPLT